MVGTLVDLMPEALFLTELARRRDVFSTNQDRWTIFRLFFSDGKPIIRFAAADRTDNPQPPSLSAPLERLQISLRRRLASFAAGLNMHDDIGERNGGEPRWTYAGLLGFLVGGELLTAIGASLFLHIDFTWAAFASLLASVFALLVSTRCHMRVVGEKRLHAHTHPSTVMSEGHLFEFLLPGPFTLVRFLLMVPTWPMVMVYAEAVSGIWPFSLLGTGFANGFSLARSEDAIWVWPLDWLRIAVPRIGTGSWDNGYLLTFLSWVIVPHLLWTIAVAIWTVLFGIWNVVRGYFLGYGDPGSHHHWGSQFADPDSPVHSLLWRLQGALGMGFTMAVATDACCLFVLICVSAILLYVAAETGTCAEQEWVFVFAVEAWWVVMLVGHAARRHNIFKRLVSSPYPNASSSRSFVSV